MARRGGPRTPDECSQCGTSIPRGALACPECGADAETGWDANPYEADADLDLPDHLLEDYDPHYDGPVLPGETWASARRGGRWYAAMIILVAVLALVLTFL
jgi:hypothetical protein